MRDEIYAMNLFVKRAISKDCEVYESPSGEYVYLEIDFYGDTLTYLLGNGKSSYVELVKKAIEIAETLRIEGRL